MAKKPNYYELLELYPAATQDEIENAFRMMLYKYHPDHNPDKADWAHEKTSAVVEAHNVLSHPLRRKIYNFLISASIKETMAERKFNIFQGGEKKKFEEAEALFKEGVNACDTNKQAAFSKFQVSIAHYKTAEALYNMGVISVQTNRLPEAQKYFTDAMNMEPETQTYKRVLEKFGALQREIEKSKQASQ